VTVTEAEKELLLRVAGALDSDASGLSPDGDFTLTPSFGLTVAEMITISRVLREAAEGWSFDVGSIPRDDTVLVCVEPTAKNNTRKRDRSVLPAYVDEDGRICDSGTWKPDPGLQGEYWRTVAWRPLPLPPSETGK
jgi:hypothetical protein